jgi:hypothetical protein
MKRLLMIVMCALPLAAQQRPASDFELQQMERQLASTHDFLAQLSARLNLGDLRLTRNETSLARAEYGKARDAARAERLAARRASAMTRYATATAYEGLAAAKLADDAGAFALLEESLRYASDSAKTWNVVASAMGVMNKPAKAAAAARNAVALARRELANEPSVANRLDLAVYEYALASALPQNAEAEELLSDIVTSLQSPAFAGLKAEVARGEQFEIYSTARGEAAAYLSLLNRAQLRLGALYEARHDAIHARRQYENVLQSRSDDPTALAALVRLAGSDEERERHFAQAFDANPFSLPLIREYQRTRHADVAIDAERDSSGTQVRRALIALQRGEWRSASTQLDALAANFPANDAIRLLQREAAQAGRALPSFLGATTAVNEPTSGDLRAAITLFASDRMTPEQRTAFDRLTFVSMVTFAAALPGAPAGQTIFASGTIDGVPFQFSEPTAFRGTLPLTAHLTYRILGATNVAGRAGLLAEPLGVTP